MNAFQAWQLLLVAVAGWMNQHQQDVITYLQEENRILTHKLKGKRIRFTDDERGRFAVEGRGRSENTLARRSAHAAGRHRMAAYPNGGHSQ